jgi:hypothetical protein
MLHTDAAPGHNSESPSARPPTALRVIASVFILGGVLSITEMVLKWTVFQRIEIDLFAIVWILTGRGLLRWREGWRRLAVLVTCLTVISVPLVAVLWFWDLCFGIGHVRYSRIGPIKGGPLVGTLAAVLISIYACWQLHILWRPDIVERFRSPPAQSVRKPWQFSLGSLMIATVFVAFVMARISSDDVRYRIERGSLNAFFNNGIMYWCDYGFRTDRFSNRRPELIWGVLFVDQRGTQTSSLGRSGDTYYLELEDGTKFSLPAESQLYEVVDGHIVPHDGHVSLEEFKVFVSQARSDWSVNGLLEHARQMREKQAAARLVESGSLFFIACMLQRDVESGRGESAQMAMNIELPAEVEQRLRAEIRDLETEAKEAMLVELYRQERLSRHDLALSLGIGRLELDGVLKRHRVIEDLPTNDELEEDLRRALELMSR